LINHFNPYTTYVDKSPAAPAGIKRNYFFGPGFHQIGIIVKEAFSLQKGYLATLSSWRIRHKRYTWYLDMWVLIFYVAAVFCTSVLGFSWMTVFSIALTIILVTGMCSFYFFFMSLWAVDRSILMFKAIQSRCPHCKRISVVPTFVCPNCGLEHKKLTPGPYGILERKCTCGKRLSTTYFNGRSIYKAICPFCASELAVSNAQQFGIQLVGGVSTGKTTFLAAFWHEYLERIKAARNVSVTAIPETAFAELEYWFQNGDSSATTETNANMYSIIHKYGNKTPVQMTIYDIAGEVFTSLSGNVQQQQFKYCEGIVFVIDPTITSAHISETISGFINEFIGLKGSHSARASDVPVAVIISKADLYKRDIGLPKIKSTFNTSAARYADVDGNSNIELVRNGVCRDFLKTHGYGNALNLIDAAFYKVQYYAVSAMGHPAEPGKKYEPWGVLDPITWLMRQHSTLFQDVVFSL
jgi:GTPase SAR1 family protein